MQQESTANVAKIGSPAAGAPQAERHPTLPERAPARGMLAPQLLKPALIAALLKLSPRQQLRNPVMFVVYAGSILTTVLFLRAALAPASSGGESAGFILAVSV